jgi:UDP-N-acetylmuramyl pentapeptide phosphotransferase/UDP-N-acetylglucosamine-1-phosphate transferase
MKIRAHDELISVEANLRSKLSASVLGARGRSQNQLVRFWITSMMLVLIGLSSLKLR